MKFIFFILFFYIGQANAETKVAITVDDLPVHGRANSQYTRKVIFNMTLQAFEKHKLKGIYGFINAKKLIEEPSGESLLKEWISSGQLLGNHTYSHASLTRSSVADYISDIQKNEIVLTKLMGDMDYRIFRYPFLHEGETLEKRNAVRNFLFSHGYKIAEVTIDWEDHVWNGPFIRCLDQGKTKEAMNLENSYIDFAVKKLKRNRELSRILFGREIPQILLVHIGAMNAKAMDRLLSEYEKNGVRFVSLSEAMKDDAYKIDPKWLSRRGEDFLDQIMQARSLKYPPNQSKVPWKQIEKVCM